MQNRKTRTVVSLLTASLLLAALPSLAQAQDEASSTPEGVIWDLVTIGGDDAMDVPADVEATLFLEGGQANGSTGCNSFSGTYTLDGQALTFDDNMAMTQAFCEGPAGEVEQAYLATLPTVVGWDADETELALLDGEQSVVLVFEPQSASVDITEADIETLITELERLHNRINNTRQDVRQLKVDSLRERVAANEAVLGEVSASVIEQDIPGLRDRVVANEAVLGELTKRFINVRVRVRDLERRVAALEAATFVAVPSDE